MNNILKKLQQLGQYGYELDFGTAIEQIFSNYKKIALTSGLVILVLVIIFYAITFALLGAAFGLGSFSNIISGSNVVGNSTGILLASLVSQVIVAVLIAPISAGMLMIAHNAEKHREFEFGTAFSMYKSPYVKDIIIATIITSLAASLLATSGTYAEHFLNYQGIALICTLLSYIIHLLTVLVLPLIIFGGLKATDAIKWSFVLVMKRPFVIIFLFVVLIIAAFIAGILAICIGIFFTLPVIYSAQYIIYRTAVGIDEEDELDSLGLNED